MSAVTMVVGLIGALGQHDLRRVLSFNLVGHIGFTTVGLALWTPAALGGSILYVLHHMLVISTLFLVSGLFLRQRRTTDLRALGGMYRAQPFVACLALVPLFSLAGIPPLSGFIAKLAVVGPMIESRHYLLAAIALAVSLLTVLSMARVWEEAFWKPAPDQPARVAHQPRLGAAILAPVAFLVTSDDRPDAWPRIPRTAWRRELRSSCWTATATCARCSERGCHVLLANLLLALAWAALQGEFSLATLVTGHVLGYLILLALVRGGVLPHVAVHRAGPPRRRPGGVLPLGARARQPAPRARRGHAALSHETGHHRRAARRHDGWRDPAAVDVDQHDARQRRARRVARPQRSSTCTSCT